MCRSSRELRIELAACGGVPGSAAKTGETAANNAANDNTRTVNPFT
jgi:hypothetical protein